MSIHRLFTQVIVFVSLTLVGLITVVDTLTIRKSIDWLSEYDQQHHALLQETVKLMVTLDWTTPELFQTNIDKLSRLSKVDQVNLYSDSNQLLLSSNSSQNSPQKDTSNRLNIELNNPSISRLEISYASPNSETDMYIVGIVVLSLATLLVFMLVIVLGFKLLLAPWYRSETFGEGLLGREWNEEKDTLLMDDTKFSQLFLKLFERYANSEALRFEQTDKIRRQSFVDKESGLGNRYYFDARLKVITTETERHTYGAVFLININFLNNDNVPHEQSIRFLRDLGEQLNDYVGNKVSGFVARRSENDLALVVELVTQPKVRNITEQLNKLLDKVRLPTNVNQNDFYNIGIAYFHPGMDTYAILSEADMALRTAQLQGTNCWYMHQKDELDDSLILGSVKWRSIIENAIDKRTIRLSYLPAFHIKSQKVLFYEVFTALAYKNDFIAGAHFFPMAHSIGLSTALDRLILDTLFKTFLYPQDLPQKLAINIYGDSLLNDVFFSWLLNHLAEKHQLAKKVIFEIPEVAFAKQEAELVARLKSLQQTGCEISVDKVGQPLASTRYLRELKVSYIKLDTTVIRDIDQHSEKQIFARSIIDICNDLKIPIIAEGVELDKELHYIEGIEIFGAQGYLLTKPYDEVPMLETVAQ